MPVGENRSAPYIVRLQFAKNVAGQSSQTQATQVIDVHNDVDINNILLTRIHVTSDVGIALGRSLNEEETHN